MNSRARRVAALFGAAAVVVTTLTIGAGSASATGDTPEPGELCRARENIQFYDTNLNPSYVVVAGDAIEAERDQGRAQEIEYGANTHHESNGTTHQLPVAGRRKAEEGEQCHQTEPDRQRGGAPQIGNVERGSRHRNHFE